MDNKYISVGKAKLASVRVWLLVETYFIIKGLDLLKKYEK